MSFARLGEYRVKLESRLLSGNRGAEYKKSDVLPAIEELDYRYQEMLDYLPEPAVHALYYKSTIDEKVNVNDLRKEETNKKKKEKNKKTLRIPEYGWILHVIYYQDQVVFESYTKIGSEITEYEKNGLLILNKGDSFWQSATHESDKKLLLNYNFETENKKVRNVKLGRTQVFFVADFADKLQIVYEKKQAELNEKFKSDAPTSLKGF